MAEGMSIEDMCVRGVWGVVCFDLGGSCTRLGCSATETLPWWTSCLLRPNRHSRRPALEPVTSLEMSVNRWVPSSVQRQGAIDEDTPEDVARKVKSLLNKLTM